LTPSAGTSVNGLNAFRPDAAPPGVKERLLQRVVVYALAAVDAI